MPPTALRRALQDAWSLDMLMLEYKGLTSAIVVIPIQPQSLATLNVRLTVLEIQSKNVEAFGG